MPQQYRDYAPSFTIDRAKHQQRLRSRLELLDQGGPSLPRLEIQADARTGATRVRLPGQPWVSID